MDPGSPAAHSGDERDHSDHDPERSFDTYRSEDEEDSGCSREECYNALWETIGDNKPYLQRRFFKSVDSLKDHAPNVEAMFGNLRKRGCGEEMAIEFLILSLYDVVILADDSFSMKIKEGGKRKEVLQSIISLMSDVYTMARPQGIVSLKFFNNPPGYKNITPTKVAKAIRDHKFSGVTRIGSELQLKILNQYAQLENMNKPLLVMVITDGAIEGEDPNLLKDVIADCVVRMQEVGKDPEASQAISFHFSRIGKDKDARIMLEELDDDKRIGKYVDCLPVDMPLEMLHGKKPGESLTPKQWIALRKLMLGGILNALDEQHHRSLFVETKNAYINIKDDVSAGVESDVELDEELDEAA